MSQVDELNNPRDPNPARSAVGRAAVVRFVMVSVGLLNPPT